MNVHIQSRNFTLTEGLRHHVQGRLRHALNHGGDIISRVVVRLSDLNGPRGGVDKSCAIEVRLKGSDHLFIEDIEADTYVAIDRAAERTGRALDRRLARLRRHDGPSHRERESVMGASTELSASPAA